MKLTLAIVALLLNVAGYIPYIQGIVKGKVKPHRYTWGIWTILTLIAAVNQIGNHGGYSALFFISTNILVIIVFGLSLKHGVGGANKLDKICLGLALALLVYWIGFREIRYSTFSPWRLMRLEQFQPS